MSKLCREGRGALVPRARENRRKFDIDEEFPKEGSFFQGLSAHRKHISENGRERIYENQACYTRK